MSALPENRRMTAEEYLAFERASDTRHEYFNGEVIAFAGASVNHVRLVQNISSLLYIHALPQGCETFPTDLRVRINKTRAYTYPDIVVVCGEPKFADDQQDTLLNPTILIEVLSPSTEMVDRVKKLAQYRALPSLQEYILVSQNRAYIEQYTRQSEEQWVYTAVTELTAKLTLQSANCTFDLTEIYKNVRFEPDQPEEDDGIFYDD
jgi:Uma2 family endonuclease